MHRCCWLTPSLPCCHLKTSNTHWEIWNPWRFLSSFFAWHVKGFSSELVALKADASQAWNILFAGMSVHLSAKKFYRLGQWRGKSQTELAPSCCCRSLLHRAILCSQAVTVLGAPILNEWLSLLQHVSEYPLEVVVYSQALFGCYMAGAMSNCCHFSTHSVHTIQPCTSLQWHFMQSYIHRVHVFSSNLSPAVKVQFSFQSAKKKKRKWSQRTCNLLEIPCTFKTHSKLINGTLNWPFFFDDRELLDSDLVFLGLVAVLLSWSEAGR